MVVAVGEEAAKEQIKQMEIPRLVRGVILSDGKIESKCAELVSGLATTLRDDLTANRKLFTDLEDKIRGQVETALRARAEEAVILIQ